MLDDAQRIRIFHFLGLIALVVAGEAIFTLPYHIVRFFRPTFIEVFQITNTQIGQMQGTYGLVAMVSYFLGGPLADRFPPKYLIITALLTTSLGGLYFLTIPGLLGLHLLYAFWGCSTILLFWSALIKATRAWGSLSEQGRAFGFLEAGRGLFAAVLSSLAFLILAFALPEQLENLDGMARLQALQKIIGVYVFATVLAAILVYLFLDSEPADETLDALQLPMRERLATVFSNRLLWPQMLIVVSAYVGYKGVDNYVLYAVQGYGMNEVDAAGISTTSAW
ncbi:MAG: MFS transporter, partial [Halioglobus sp.]